MKVVEAITELIGQTPMIRLNRMAKGGSADIYLKLESFNPGNSVKDRIALNMVEAAEREGKLSKKSTIIEPTSGNTGIGLAMVGAAKGYHVVVVMPDTMSLERRTLLQAYGAQLVLTPGEKGMKGAIEKAKELVEEHSDYFMPQQFENPNNPEIHRKTTAMEILTQMDNKIDVFIAGVGSGGTITGVGQVLKENIDDIRIVAVEPANSPVLSGGLPNTHKIQGIGAGFVPKVLDPNVYDEIVKVKDEDAIRITKLLAKKEGILLGVSTGAVVYAAMRMAKELGEGKQIVAIAADTGERYLSTSLFKEK